MKKIRFVNKYKNMASDRDDQMNSEIEDSTDAVPSNIGVGVKNRIKLNQTLELSKRELNIENSLRQSVSNRNNKQTLSQG